MKTGETAKYRQIFGGYKKGSYGDGNYWAIYPDQYPGYFVPLLNKGTLCFTLLFFLAPLISQLLVR